MRKRVAKTNETSSATSAAPRPVKVQRKQRSCSWLKRGLLSLLFIFVLAPFTLKFVLELIQHFVYTQRIRLPFFDDLGRPADFSLNHTINMYLTSERGISLGVWHTVPESRWKEAQGKDLAWYQNTFNDGSPVFIYLHGNTGTRAATHRVGVAKVLSTLGYHVLVPDYRGFGDSTGEPTEAGLTTDALYLYNWVKARSGSSLVVIWGHSLGTGVTTNTAVKLAEQGAVFDGVILEGAFNNAPEQITDHCFSWYYWKFPGIGYFFPEPWAENKIVFPSEENVKKMRNPILFLHAEDDHIVPIEIAQKVFSHLKLFPNEHILYKAAVSSQNAERVKLVSFDASLGYLHNGLYKDPRLPDIITRFVSSL